MGAVAKSYMRKGLLIYEETRNDFATAPPGFPYTVKEEKISPFFQCVPSKTLVYNSAYSSQMRLFQMENCAAISF